jgi:hypothetical protein
MRQQTGSGWFLESHRHSLASHGIRSGRRIINDPQFRNLKMNPDTYVLRRKVIDLLYEIKKFDPNIPRVEVRITDNAPERIEKNCRFQPLALAWMNKAKMDRCVIWVSKKAVADADLRTIVYHEVLHTIYGIPHIESNKLMKHSITHGVPPDEAKKIYLALKQEYGGK